VSTHIAFAEQRGDGRLAGALESRAEFFGEVEFH
jgi:hypothetical protein